jgi:hypothetical protein
MSQKDLSASWSPGIEYILEEIRLNSINISECHKQKYYYAKGYLKYFRIPTIVFSAMNSVFSVGLQPYCPQPIISLICCIISLVCGVISSIELFLSIQSTMENELVASKDFYLLSVNIFKILSLERGTRMINGKVYLDETYQTYCKLIENSNIVNSEMKNMITPKMLIDTKREETNNTELVVVVKHEKTRKNNEQKEEEDEVEEIEEVEEEKEKEIVEEKKIEMEIEVENIRLSEIEENRVVEDEDITNNEAQKENKDEEQKDNVVLEKVKRKYTKKKV